MDLHFVAPGLAVGACFPMSAAARLAREHGISRVVDVRVEDRDDEAVLAVHGIRLLHLPTQDTRAIASPRIDHGVAFAVEGLARGEGVLVHCQYGIGRSALLALCVLVARGDPPLEALRRAKKARPVISPSPEQLEAFAAFAARHRAAAAVAWDVPTVDELGGIAWSHLRGPDAARDGAGAREEARAASTRAKGGR